MRRQDYLLSFIIGLGVAALLAGVLLLLSITGDVGETVSAAWRLFHGCPE
jgi:hypothetical protein